MARPRIRCSTLALTAAILGGGCASLGMPDPEPGLVRHRVTPRATTCRGESCTYDVGIAGSRYRVRRVSRTISPEEAIGEGKPSRARRVAGVVGGALLRGMGLTTSSRVVVLETRTAADPAAGLVLRCELVGVHDIDTERVDGEDVKTTTRRAGGYRCVASGVADSASRWHLAAGVAPVPDSIAAALRAIPLGSAPIEDGMPPRLVRLAGDTVVARYVVERAHAAGGLRASWTVRREDGARVGMIVAAIGMPRALDTAPDAEPEELALLRLLVVTLFPEFGDW